MTPVTIAECPHGMGDPAWCSICKHGPVKVERPEIVATFRARYDGDCRGCSLPISVGQIVHKLSNDAYVHQGCQA